VNTALVLAYVEEAERRGLVRSRWVLGLHPKQQIAFNDNARAKAILAGRRGGKTFLALAALYEAALRNPGSVALYLALTARSARTILWSELLRFKRRYHLDMELRRSELSVTLPNGSTIMLAGADQEDSHEKLRGPAYSIAIIDEAASFSNLRYLIEEVLEPALADFDGSIWLVGTPGAACAGYFWAVSTGLDPEIPKWPTYQWDLRDNPRFAGRAQAYLDRKLQQKGWTESTPAYRREYLGQWVRDLEWLVYQFDRSRNVTFGQPEGLTYVVSVDLGASEVERSTAFCVLGYLVGDAAYVVRCYKRAGMTVGTIGDELHALVEEFAPVAIVVDAGGLGGAYVKELKARVVCPLRAAEKQHKLAYIELCNSDLRTGKLQIVTNGVANDNNVDLLSELEILQWDEQRRKPDSRYADHCCDALLYGWRECRHYLQAAAPETEDDEDDEYLTRLEEQRKQPFWRQTA